MRFELLFSSVSHRKKPERIPTFPRKARTIPHTPFMLRPNAKTDPPMRTRRLGLSCRSDALPRPHERGNGCGTVAGRLRAKGRPAPSSGTGPPYRRSAWDRRRCKAHRFRRYDRRFGPTQDEPSPAIRESSDVHSQLSHGYASSRNEPPPCGRGTRRVQSAFAERHTVPCG